MKILIMKTTITHQKIDILDKGHVEYVDHMGSDLTVVNAARVSFAKTSQWETTEDGSRVLSQKDQRLIKYLANHNHWTPFAHPQITLRIKAPIFVRTQLFKHKVGFTENEISRRYVTNEPEFYVPEWRSAPTDGAKQGSSDFITDLYVNDLDRIYTRNALECIDIYKELLKEGVAPEQARAILPQGTYTEWWWTGSLSAYARVFKQRIDAHAQWEVQQYAGAIGKILEPLFPHSWAVLTAK
jgi:thymidylate synthase (FAD)